MSIAQIHKAKETIQKGLAVAPEGMCVCVCLVFVRVCVACVCVCVCVCKRAREIESENAREGGRERGRE